MRKGICGCAEPRLGGICTPCLRVSGLNMVTQQRDHATHQKELEVTQ